MDPIEVSRQAYELAKARRKMKTDPLATIPKGAKPVFGLGPKSTMQRLWSAYATSDDFSAFLGKANTGPPMLTPTTLRLIWDAFDFAYEAARDEFDPPKKVSARG